MSAKVWLVKSKGTFGALVVAGMLSACGGGGGGGGSSSAGGAGVNGGQAISSAASTGGITTPTEADAYRFLNQASFGADAQSVAQVRTLGFEGWINAQLDGTRLAVSHVDTVTAASARMGSPKPRTAEVIYSWWTHTMKDPAQMRQRMAYALSQIFVVSTMDSTVGDHGRWVASYLDMLTEQSTGTYRQLIQAVALHPAMGVYLSSLQNRKEDPASGRVPDENFAREVMQLFSIGLYELNDDGTQKLRDGKPIETYTSDDVKGMAKVFTGWGWARPPGNSVEWYRCFWRDAACNSPVQDVMPMAGYADMHSTSEKRFLGVTVPAQSVGDPYRSLQIALDRLATHPNTAPFISKQLIQRLVTSNPTPAYVGRVTAVFRATGGNLKAVYKAILLDVEARNPAGAGVDIANYGKLREPVLRLTHVMRNIPHYSSMYDSRSSTQGLIPFYLASDTDNPAYGLGQTPMRSPSVFNFYRPGYKPPQTQLGAAGLVSPEMQITNETSVLGYANFISNILDQGWGVNNTQTGKLDIQFDLSMFQALDDGTARPQNLVDEAARRLLGQTLPTALNERVVVAVGAMPRNNDVQRRRRAAAAIAMVAVSPTFIVQQ